MHLLSPEISFQLGFYGLLDFVQLGLVVDVPITVLLGVHQGTVNLHLRNSLGKTPLNITSLQLQRRAGYATALGRAEGREELRQEYSKAQTN